MNIIKHIEDRISQAIDTRDALDIELEKLKQEEMTVRVKIKDVYGTAKTYPANRNAELFAKIAGTKTLTDKTLETIKELNYIIEQVLL